jgi:hypothetical protein
VHAGWNGVLAAPGGTRERASAGLERSQPEQSGPMGTSRQS